MTAADTFFLYCERAAEPSFWAEPFNAVSNGAFVIAALFAAIRLTRSDGAEPLPRAQSLWVWALIANAAAIGVGSFLFHTFATRWALIADTSSIVVFVVSYLAYALRHVLRWSWIAVAAGLALLVAASLLTPALPCRSTLLPITAAAGLRCLNGSLNYLPALASLIAVAGILYARGHRAARSVALAAAVFALSLVVRTVDVEICAVTEIFGRARGTHALWHVCNAVTIYILLFSAIEHARAALPRLRHRA